VLGNLRLVSFRHARGSQGTQREHGLNVDPKARPVKRPKRKAIAAELHRLENAGFIREIKTLTWVSNPVIAPKKNTDVRGVCVDYTSLNKHCPRDPFPLPRIDQIIDSTAGCARLSFWTHIRDTVRSSWRKKTKKIRPLSHHTASFVTKSCLSASKDDAKLSRKPNRSTHPSIHR
jgi:hypothetical protein